MIILGYIASIFMGVTLGMLGGGGSILTVPILVYLFQINPVEATAYSLFIVGVTALIGGLKFLKSKQIDFKTGTLFAIPSFIGVYLTRAYLVPFLPKVIIQMGPIVISKDAFIMLLFAIMMILASISMIRGGAKEFVPSNRSSLFKSTVIGLEGLIIGSLTGLVGAGGGFMIIPALVILVGLPMKVAVGTSLFIIASKSLVGFVGDLQTDLVVNWQLLLSMSFLGIVGIIIGSTLSSKVSDQSLKKVFGYFVLAMGAFIILESLI